jgi:hypothetical protein
LGACGNGVDLGDGVDAIFLRLVFEPECHLAVGVGGREEAGGRLRYRQYVRMWQADLQCVTENCDVEMPLGKDTLEHCFADSLTGLHADVLHALLSEVMLFLGQPPGLAARWEAGKDKVAENSNGQAQTPIDDEQPASSGHSMHAIRVLVRGSLQVPPEHNPEIVGEEPNAVTFENSFWSVPRSEDIGSSGGHRCFQNAEEEPGPENVVFVPKSSLGEGEDGPEDFHFGKVPPGDFGAQEE